MIKKCTCKSVYQDKKYGDQNRVHNPGKSLTADKRIWRCTVCGKEK